MTNKKQAVVVLLLVAFIGFIQCKNSSNKVGEVNSEPADSTLISEGKNIFRFDSFGDEDFWSGLLHIDKAIAGAANGGFGAGVSPKAALAAYHLVKLEEHDHRT